MIYQISKDHGYHVAYSPQEAKANEETGWETVTKEQYYDRGEKSPKPDDGLSIADKYYQLFGKKPHHNMKLENIQAAIEDKIDGSEA